MTPLIPYPERKVFGGKSFYLVAGVKTKKEATDLIRLKGGRTSRHLFRVFSPKSRKLPKYLVYDRWEAK